MQLRSAIAVSLAPVLLGAALTAMAGAAAAEQAPAGAPPADVAPQASPDDVPDPATDPASDPATDPAAEPAIDEAEAARAARLDGLFAALADPANTNWQATEAQIRAAWAESGSASMDLLARRADKASAAEDYDGALAFLDDLVRLAPDYAEGWNKRATVHFLLDDYGPALHDIARTLAIEPRHFEAWAGLGIILDRLGDEEGALDAYQRAIALHPHLPGAAEGIAKLTREIEGERI